jgi:hypothetical protein
MLGRPFTLAVFVVSLAGCDASGSVQGGDPLEPDPCAATDGGHTWSDLYACYFGPTGQASCSGQGTCHGSCSGTGALTSGFVCGGTKESCYLAIMQPNCCGQITSDAGAEAAAAECAASFPPVVPQGGASDPTTTTLWTALRGVDPKKVVGLHNMPFTSTPGQGYTFSAADLDRISAWIEEGAPQN